MGIRKKSEITDYYQQNHLNKYHQQLYLFHFTSHLTPKIWKTSHWMWCRQRCSTGAGISHAFERCSD